jgi:hypothetical protein
MIDPLEQHRLFPPNDFAVDDFYPLAVFELNSTQESSREHWSLEAIL